MVLISVPVILTNIFSMAAIDLCLDIIYITNLSGYSLKSITDKATLYHIQNVHPKNFIFSHQSFARGNCRVKIFFHISF